MNLYDVDFKIKGNKYIQSAMPIAESEEDVRIQFQKLRGVKILKIQKSPFGKEIIAEIEKQNVK
jgi:hypothetical protein